MFRRWTLGALAVLALAIAASAYHLVVTHHSAEHFRLLLESRTVEEKKLHLEEIRRFYDPFNPYLARARRWVEEEGHEWRVPWPCQGDINGGTILEPRLRQLMEKESPLLPPDPPEQR